jgi:hypothetical protein
LSYAAASKGSYTIPGGFDRACFCFVAGGQL